MNGGGLRDVLDCRIGRDGVQRQEMSLEDEERYVR